MHFGIFGKKAFIPFFLIQIIQSNIPNFSTEKLIKILLIGDKDLDNNKVGGSSIIDFIDSFPLENFAKYRLHACVV